MEMIDWCNPHMRESCRYLAEKEQEIVRLREEVARLQSRIDDILEGE